MPQSETELADRVLRLEREAALLRLPHVYAQAIDRRDRTTLGDLFTTDAVFERPPKPTRDYNSICAIPDELESRYLRTYHAVYNQTFEIDGTTATGEVYCIAHHMFANHDDFGASYDLRIRYQDRYVLGADDRWRFTYRCVLVDGRQVIPVVL
ncbi:MAG: nuclear transport factor 2 family protein [Acidimicrobiia bacterium]